MHCWPRALLACNRPCGGTIGIHNAGHHTVKQFLCAFVVANAMIVPLAVPYLLPRLAFLCTACRLNRLQDLVSH